MLIKGSTIIRATEFLTYNEFEKFVTIKKQDKKFSISIFSEDPTGRLVLPGEKYLPNEKFYLCVNDKNQFEALENTPAFLSLLKTLNSTFTISPPNAYGMPVFITTKKTAENSMIHAEL